MRKITRNKGFTLPEVITSVAIFSMVIFMIYSCWAAVLQATESSTVAAENAHRERVAVKAIEDALAGASWYENHLEGPLDLYSISGFSHLKIISRVPPGFWGERELGGYPLRRIEFSTEPTDSENAQLVMVQQALLGGTNALKTHRTVLLPRVEQFSVEVQGRLPEASWESSWEAPDGLPVRARISLGAVEEFPRLKTVSIFATLAAHAKGPPGIGTVTNIAGSTFGQQGFDTGEEGEAARLVFIIDKSGSMWGEQLQMAKDALFKSLNGMGGEGNFYIYFYNHSSDAMRLNSGVENPGTRSPMMLEANAANIAKVKEWIVDQNARGGTNPTDSLHSAFTHKPTELYLLTDGEFVTRRGDPMVREQIQSLNSGKSTKIHTLAVGDSLRGTEGEAALMIIAKENGGTYTFIDPLAPSTTPVDSVNPPAPNP